MKKSVTRLLTALLALSIMLSQLPPPPPAQAQDPLANALIGLVNVIGAAGRRNRVYREARVTQRDMDSYYDTLTDSAQQRLLDRDFVAPDGNQLRVYMRLRAAMLAEQEAVTDQIEAEKNQARQQFNRTLGRELFQVLVRSPGGQSLLGELRQSIDELRQAAEAVESAIADNRPFDALAQEFADRAGNIPLLRDTAYNLGHAAGQKIDNLLGGVVSKVDQAMANMQAGMGDALDEIERIDSELAEFDETERQPVSLVEEGSPLGQIRGVDRANAAVDVAAQAYTNAAIAAGALRNPSQEQTASMRDRIRDQLLQDRLQRLGQLRERANQVKCEAAGLDSYIQAANQLGLPLEQPADPSQAAYIICRQVGSGQPVHAMVVREEPEVTVEPSEQVAENGTQQPDQEGPALELAEDRCSLTGEGDFVIENLSNVSESNTCEGDGESYPFGLPGDPLLLMMAASGKWVISDQNPVETTWQWQQSEPVEGAAITGTAVADGSTLEIEVNFDIGPTSASDPLRPAHANGLAVLAMLPLVPLTLSFKSSRKRRYLLLAITLLSLLLIAQSCDVFGTFSGSYSLPLPEQGFACEVDPDNPNLAEMPGSSGEVVMQVTIVDYDESGNQTSSENCEYTAAITGLGVLKRDGVYTEDTLQAAE